MATNEEIRRVLDLLHESKPKHAFKKLDDTTAGIGAVMRCLYKTDEPVTAGQISRILNVSTARVAVLLRKMESKGLIIKETGAADARTTVVRISDDGRKAHERIRAELYRDMGNIIDHIGMERMLEYIAISKEINALTKPPCFTLDDKD